MDKLDKKICGLIQKNSAITAAELGNLVGLSTSATQRRINKLKESGVIEAEVAVLSPGAFDFPLTLFIEVTLVGDKTREVEEFCKFVSAHPNVQQCYFVTGDEDYIIIYIARTMEDYQVFAKSAFFDKDYVQTFKTKVVMKTIKKTLEIPL